MLVSGVQLTDSDIYFNMYILYFIYILHIYFIFFSIIGDCKLLNTVSCAKQLVLVGYLFYI